MLAKTTTRVHRLGAIIFILGGKLFKPMTKHARFHLRLLTRSKRRRRARSIDHGAAGRPRVGVQNYRPPLRAGADGFLTWPNISLPLLEKEAHGHLAVHRRRGGEILAGMLELTGAAVEFA